MMFLMLNKDNVIIDIVETVKPVKKNSKGMVILCGTWDAQGYIGRDNDTVYNKLGADFPSYTDIAQIVQYDGEAMPIVNKYIDGEIVENDDDLQFSNKALTVASEKNSADLEYVAMMTGVDI